MNTGLSRFSAEGGIAEKLFETKPQDGDLDTDSPDVLPGSHAVLYTLHQLDGGARIEAYIFETGERRVLVDDAFRPRYAATGHIVYGTGAGTLFAASFDLARLEITGPPVRVLENVFTIKDGPGMVYTIANDGTLIYRPEPSWDGRALVGSTPVATRNHSTSNREPIRTPGCHPTERGWRWRFATETGRERVLFEGDYVSHRYHSGYDVAPDGRFLMIKPAKTSSRNKRTSSWRTGSASSAAASRRRERDNVMRDFYCTEERSQAKSATILGRTSPITKSNGGRSGTSGPSQRSQVLSIFLNIAS